MSVIEKPKTYRRGREHRQPIEIVGDPARELLWEAANLLERGKWRTGYYFGLDGKPGGPAYCMVGALNVAAGEKPHSRSRSRNPVKMRARKLLAKTLGIKSERLTAWNDRLGRTKEEVIDALRRASEAPE
jgi:hypothetical protein